MWTSPQTEEACAAGDDEGPRQPLAHEFPQIGRRRNARGYPLEVSGTLRPWRLGKAGRKRSVQPQDDRGRHEAGEKDSGLGADGRPEDIQIADRGKPQPIDQQVARESQQDQADRDNDGAMMSVITAPRHRARGLGPVIPIVMV